MNFYPEHLKFIANFCEALNKIEVNTESTLDMPYPKAIELTDEHGTDWGVLRDEVGVAWSWFPPKDPE